MVKNICNLIFGAQMLHVCFMCAGPTLTPMLWNCFRMGEVTSVEQLPLPKRTAKSSTSESKHNTKTTSTRQSKEASLSFTCYDLKKLKWMLSHVSSCVHFSDLTFSMYLKLIFKESFLTFFFHIFVAATPASNRPQVNIADQIAIRSFVLGQSLGKVCKLRF